MNIPRLENRSTTVMMLSWPLVASGNPETQSMDTVCHLVSGTGNGLGTLAVSNRLDFAATHIATYYVSLDVVSEVRTYVVALNQGHGSKDT